MVVPRPPLSRRAVLRGAGGVALALPFLEAMLGAGSRARAAGRVPRRFVAVFQPNGYVRDAWRPTGGETDFVLSRSLKPLAAFRDRLVVVDGLDIKSRGSGSPHMKGIGGVFTGCELRKGTFEGGGTTAGFANGPSIDQYLAAKVGGATRLRSLELGVKCDGRATPETRAFYDVARQPVPPLGSPKAAFDRLFTGFTFPAGGATPAPPVDRRHDQRKLVLDFVLDDYRRLRGTLGGTDRARLDAHLAAVEDIERRMALASAAPQTGAVAAACAKPSASFSAGGGVCQGQDDCTDGDLLAVGRLHMDLIALAFACDLVRVAALQWSNAGNRIVYRSLGHTQTHHDLAHASAKEPLTQIDVWHAEQAAYLLGKLAGVREADGSTLLDASLVLFGNELSNGATHSLSGVPFLIAGKAGGALRTGRYLKAPGMPHNALLTACLHAMGIADQGFGTLSPETGAVPGLLA